MIVFLKHSVGPHPSTGEMLATFVLTYAISYVSWRFVETPFRTGDALTTGTAKVFAAFGLVAASLGLSALVIANEGFPHRAPEKSIAFHAARNNRSHQHSVGCEKLCNDDVPSFGEPSGSSMCLIWGDSHAMSLIAGLDAACKQVGVVGLQATYFGTAPILDFHMTTGLGLREKAVEQSRAVFEMAKRQHVDVVVLAAYWARYETNTAIEDRLAATIDELIGQGMKVAVVLDFAAQGEDVPLMLARTAFRGDPTNTCGLGMKEYRVRNDAMNAMIRRVAKGRAMVLDPAPFLTDSKGVWRAEMDGVVLYYDDDHLSTQGSLRLAPMFVEMFEGIRLPQAKDRP